MDIILDALVESGNQDLVDMALVDYGMVDFPSGAIAILEPMTWFTEIDSEIAARRIEVPGPAMVTAAVVAAGNLDARPFAIMLTFSDAQAITASHVASIDVDVARIMFADAVLLADTWVRDEADHRSSKSMSLAQAVDRKLLSCAPIYAAEQSADAEVLVAPGIVTTRTGWGDGQYEIVRHDDADGNLVRILVSFLDDNDCNPVDFIDFGPVRMIIPEPLPLAA